MWKLDIENIGGIRSGEASLDAGLNIVQASNFQGKSSFMSAIQTAMGTTGMYGQEHPLTEGADSGSVVLDTGDEEYQVSLNRETRTVSRTGEPYLTDETDRVCAHLFAFLGEDNPIRSAVRNREDLTELLQAPLNIEDINAQISSLQQERQDLQQELRNAENAANKLPEVQEEVTQLEGELEDLRVRRDELSEEVTEETGGESLSDKLGDKQGSLDNTNSTISRVESRIERKKQTLEEKEAELEDIEVPSEPEITANIDEKEERINSLTSKISLLEDLHRVNQQIIDDNEVDLVSDVERSITADEINCWVCGSETTTEDIEGRLDGIQDKIKSLRSEKSSLRSEVKSIQQQQREIEKKERERDRLEQTIGSIKADIREAEGELQQAQERQEDFEQEVSELKKEVEEAEEELNEELTDVKAEISNKERDLKRKSSEIEDLESKADEADELEAERERLSEEITELRERKTQKQYELKEQFDQAIGEVIDKFAPGFDGAHLDVKTSPNGDIEGFELTVAREGRQTTLNTLSEGELELVGIVVAIAGYRTYDVDERVPAILIDGVGQLASDNLRNLTEYLEDASKILVTTAYPEAGEFSGKTISPSEWDVVSDRETAAA